MNHPFDKPILRDLFWFVVLPYRARQWLVTRKPEGRMNWIKTSEGLPGIDDYDVLLYCGDTKEMFVGEYVGQDLFQYAVDRHGERIVCRPTHWQPLPEPPSDAADRREG